MITKLITGRDKPEYCHDGALELSHYHWKFTEIRGEVT